MKEVTKRLRIRGLVQGVGYRYSMHDAAKTRGVRGWVRNCPDETVEAVLQGTEDQVASMIEWAKKGPWGANVTDVEVSDEGGLYDDFSIRFFEGRNEDPL